MAKTQSLHAYTPTTYVDFHSAASTYMSISSPTVSLLAIHGPIVVAMACPSAFRTLRAQRSNGHRHQAGSHDPAGARGRTH